MKKLLVVYSLLSVSTLLLSGCGRCCKKVNTEHHIDVVNHVQNDIKDSAVTYKKTDSGLEYEVLKEGHGESPKAGQQVTVDYTGWLDNNGQLGTQFDSSVDRNQPFVFTVGIGQVIPGWDEGVMSMKVGEKRRLIIPSELGYGAYGAGNVIPPHAKLIFDVELLHIS